MVRNKSPKSKRCPISGKVMIANNRLALKRAEFINKQKGEIIIKSTYKCPHCSTWHISSMSTNEHKNHIRNMVLSQRSTGDIMQDVSNRLEYLRNKKL